MAANTSFLPQDYLEKRIEQRTNVICLSLFCIVLVALVAVWWVTNRQQAQDQRITDEDDKKFIDADQRLQQLEEMKTRSAEMVQKARITAALLERVPRTLILSELINNMPPPMTLLDMEVSTRMGANRPAPTTLIDKAKLERNNGQPGVLDVQPPDTDVTLDVVGVTPTDIQVAQFMTALGRSPIFQDLTLSYTEDMDVDGDHMRKFAISMTINQDIDIKTIQPRMVKRDDLQRDPMEGPVQVRADGKLIMPSALPAPRETIIPAYSH